MSTLPNPILQANLAALAGTSPAMARAVLAAPARPDLQFATTDDGVLSATVGFGPDSRQLASRRRPLEEGRRLAETVDLVEAAGALVLGFGMGWHAKALVERLPQTPEGTRQLAPWGVVVVFEPDASLLRAVLERVDHSGWLRRGDVVFVSEPTQAAVAAAMQRREALPFLGRDVAFLEHPAQRARLGESGTQFVSAFREWLSGARTTVRTTLLNCHVTTRNSLMNLDRYVTASGVADLAGAAWAKPAIVVSAGPSLRRNIALLKGPGVRERFVIIAVQTVLKTLLAEGIRPHFVTALDYHEVSRRFYEGLNERDVEGVTLVAESKANPAILGAFPGDVRVPADPFLEELIGEDLSRVLGMIRPGATVAHMAYYLARLLGCDPVILIGQDLGFTDGQYYAAGAAIHDVWGSELSEFRTLEMMEWERIVRGKFTIGSARTADGQELAREQNLLKRTDVLGRPIYIDQQMATYLSQFERDFRDDEERGLSVIDATEGGVAKSHTTPMTLKQALERHGASAGTPLPPPAPADDAEARVRRTTERVRRVRQDVWRIAEHSRRAAKLIGEMLEWQQDQSRVNRLIAQAHTLGEEVAALRPAFALVQHLNQAGSLKRVRADREIALARSLPPIERQRKELERDLSNVQWLAEAADELGSLLDATVRMLGGGARLTGELPRTLKARAEELAGTPESRPAQSAAARGERARIVAMIAVDPVRSGLGTPRDLSEDILPGKTALRCVLERLAACREIDGVVLICEHPEAARRLISDAPRGLRVDIIRAAGDVLGQRGPAVRGARLWAASSWRGGLGGLACYDEACAPSVMAPVMDAHGIDAAAVVGADWALIDPALVDMAVARFREGAGDVRLTFCQAPPGVGTCVLERTLMRDLASNTASAGALATIGGRLSYSPLVPMPDPIANLRPDSSGRPVCITCPQALRDCGLRLAAESGPSRELVARLIRALGQDWARAGTDELARVITGLDAPVVPGESSPRSVPLPREFVLELCTGRLTSGRRGAWLRGGMEVERPVMTTEAAGFVLRQIAELRTDAPVTLFGAGDPLLHPELGAIITGALRAGVGGVHVRTDLVGDERAVDALLESGAEVISIDLMAETAPTYRAMMGADLFDRARANLQRLLERRAKLGSGGAGGLPFPWIVPRLTRCDETYEEIEAFYERWSLFAGAAVIDPMPGPAPGERIAPLPVPAPVARRIARERMIIRSDGSALCGAADTPSAKGAGDLTKDDLMPVWKKAIAASGERAIRAAIDVADHEGRALSGGPARERDAEFLAGHAR